MNEFRLTRVSTAELVEDDYFTNNPAPKSLDNYADLAGSFVDAHLAAGRRMVLITSGGTTVPLENQTVRFIDNFSAGTRGATSAEYFLEAGYAVIFLHRKFSLLPYSRHYSHSTNCFLDFMMEEPNGRVSVKQEYQQDMKDVLRKYSAAKQKNLLLLLPFTTITEYLWALRTTSYAMEPLGSSAMLYLAAAVSDFFVPKNRLSEHKIQSCEVPEHPERGSSDVKPKANGAQGSKPPAKKLMIDLDPVPKFLKRLVDGWAPGAMIVSFKLETDPDLLIYKARTSLERYSHHLVIGNVLSTRSFEVVFVTPDDKERWIQIPSHRRVKSFSARPNGFRRLLSSSDAEMNPLEGEDHAIDDRPIEIESIIVPQVIKLHEKRLTMLS